MKMPRTPTTETSGGTGAPPVPAGASPAENTRVRLLDGRCLTCGQPFNPRSTSEICPACLLFNALREPTSTVDSASSVTHQQFGDFELLEEIGRGGIGIVYRARQRVLGRIVALKLLQPGRMLSAGEVVRFQREAETIASLEHAHIVPLFDAGEHDGQPWIALRLMPGGSLADQLRTAVGPRPQRIQIGESASSDPSPSSETLSQTLSDPSRTAPNHRTGEGIAPNTCFNDFPHIAHFIQKLALAVHHAHQRGILHGDLKPANVLLDEQGEPALADFGLARALDTGAVATRTLTFFGSPAYAAPEQAARDRREITTSADIYGLGAILYEMLSGHPPFEGRDLADTFRKVLEEEPIRPSVLLARRSKSEVLNPKSEIPVDLETICLKCLEKDPARRYASAHSLADDLQRYLNNEPIAARPITRAAKLIRWSQRNPALATAYSLLILLLIIILIASPLAIYRIDRARKAEAAARNTAEAQSYVADMNLADQEWEDGDLLHARSRLLDHLPKQGERDLRGFEWAYLWNLCRDESRRSFSNFNPTVRFTLTPDQKFFAVATDHAINCFDYVGNNAELTLASDPDQTISSFAFSAAGTNLLAIGFESGTVKLWDLTSKHLLSTFTNLLNPVSALAFSGDRRYLAATVWSQKKVALWDISLGTNLWSRETSVQPTEIRFAPDSGSLICGGGPEGGNALLWDLEGNSTPFPPEHKGWVEKLAFSPDGRWLATGSPDSTTILWDFASHKSFRRIHGSDGVAFSPDGQRIAVGDGSSISLWQIDTGERLRTLRGHEATIKALEFSVDGRALLSESLDGTLKVWDLGSQPALDMLTGHTGWIGEVAFSPDGKLLASLNHFPPFFTRLWDVASRTALTNLLGPTSLALGMCISPDGSMLATGSADKTIHIWNLMTHDLLMILTNESRAGLLSFSRDSRILGVVDAGWLNDGKPPAFWDVSSRQRIPGLMAAGTNATAIVFARKSDMLALGYSDGAVQVWDFSHRRQLCAFQSHSALIWSLAFNKEETLLASASDDGLAAIYDLRTQRAFPPLRDHAGAVWSVAFARDGKTLATASQDSTIKLWHLGTRKPALTLKGHLGSVVGLAFAPDGQLLASAGADGTIRLWSAPSIDSISQTNPLQ